MTFAGDVTLEQMVGNPTYLVEIRDRGAWTAVLVFDTEAEARESLKGQWHPEARIVRQYLEREVLP